MPEDFSIVSLLIGLVLGGAAGWGFRHWQAQRDMTALGQRYAKAKKALRAATEKTQQGETERAGLQQNLVQALQRPPRVVEKPVEATPAVPPQPMFDSSLIGLRLPEDRDFADTQIVDPNRDR